MSEVSQGPGWWLASDGKWYSPDQSPGYAPAALSYPPPFGPPIGPSGVAYGPSSTPSGYAPPTDPRYGYPVGSGPYGYSPLPRTNGLAVAAMVCSFFFWLYGIGAILGIVFGFIARSQIKQSGGTQQGKGMALAGIIIGFAGIAIGIIVVIVLVALVHHCEQDGNCTQTSLSTGG